VSTLTIVLTASLLAAVDVTRRRSERMRAS
jgi:hypothetical protein